MCHKKRQIWSVRCQRQTKKMKRLKGGDEGGEWKNRRAR